MAQQIIIIIIARAPQVYGRLVSERDALRTCFRLIPRVRVRRVLPLWSCTDGEMKVSGHGSSRVIGRPSPTFSSGFFSAADAERRR